VLGRVLALAAPGDQQQGGQAVEQRQRGERVEAGAESGVLHEHAGAPTREPRARGDADPHVLAHRGHVGPGGAGRTFEGGDQPLEQGAGDAREEVEAMFVEEAEELAALHYSFWEVRFSSS
jgi:hypothetical protein